MKVGVNTNRKGEAMGNAFTAKVILLKGDPKKPESAQHIIKFPGGSIEVSRTSDNEYWAHIEVYKGNVLDENVRESANGTIVASRLDYDHPKCEILEIPDADQLIHLAVRISTKGEKCQ
jgi:hypothetical protein